jgi:hypothetical protein
MPLPAKIKIKKNKPIKKTYEQSIIDNYKRKKSTQGRTDRSGDIVPEGYNKGQINQYTPEQTELYKRSFGQTAPDSYTSRLAAGDQSLFEEIEAPAWKQFQQAQGQLGSRFSELASGANSARRGGGFQRAANQQSSDFSMDLQAKRQELQRGAISDLGNMTHQLLGERPIEKFLAPKPQKPQKQEKKGFVEQYGPLINTAASFAAAII